MTNTFSMPYTLRFILMSLFLWTSILGVPQAGFAEEAPAMPNYLIGSDSVALSGGNSLNDIVRRGLLSNPMVNAKWEALQSTANEQDAARGGYFPRLDFSLSTGYEEYKTSTYHQDFDPAEGTLTLTQMLYDGFATSNEVKRLGHEKLARLYDFFESAESTALEITTAYIDLLRYRELLGFAEENLLQHQQLFEQVQERVEAGVGRGVDLEQATGRLALAQSNVTTERNNLHDVSARFLRLVGELPQTELPVPGDFSKGIIPTDIETTLRQAFKNSPVINAAVERVQATEKAVDVREANYQPRVELRAYHQTGSDRSQIDGHSNESVIELALDYNLFRGGADKATINQLMRNENQAKELRVKACRDVRQTTTIAYNDIRNLETQLQFLKQHYLSIANARDAYRDQFNIGQRTLLDLLDTQNEFFQSQRAYTKSSYDYILAHARTLEGMGQLLTALDIRSSNVPSLDVLIAQRGDYDAEAFCTAQAIPDVLFNQASSIEQSTAVTSFAPQLDNDTDGDGVPFSKDRCPNTPAGTIVTADGCPERVNPVAQMVSPQQQEITAGEIIDTIDINFATGSSKIPKNDMWKIARLADGLKKYPNTRILLGGHTDNIGSRDYNEKLSHDRVVAIRERLIFNHRVPPNRIFVTWLNFAQPIAGNDTAEGRKANRRVEVQLQRMIEE